MSLLIPSVDSLLLEISALRAELEAAKGRGPLCDCGKCLGCLREHNGVLSRLLEAAKAELAEKRKDIEWAVDCEAKSTAERDAVKAELKAARDAHASTFLCAATASGDRDDALARAETWRHNFEDADKERQALAAKLAEREAELAKLRFSSSKFWSPEVARLSAVVADQAKRLGEETAAKLAGRVECDRLGAVVEEARRIIAMLRSNGECRWCGYTQCNDACVVGLFIARTKPKGEP